MEIISSIPPYPLQLKDRKLLIDEKKVTEFQFRVYDALLKRNPYAPYVPCHRVISATGELGAYSTKKGVCPNSLKKQNLLVKEGVFFVQQNGKYKLTPEKLKTYLHQCHDF
ncbi:hypothetical protein HMI56_006172 [Coelomomyces lativittatus]|nr:hypothetical protein HMI56_006172 [Coelomomyces lativittatus]